MPSLSLGVLNIGGVSPYSMLDFLVLGAIIAYISATTLLTMALSSTSTRIMEYTLVEAICLANGAQTTWIIQGARLRASCTGTAFRVLKLLDFLIYSLR